MTARRRFFAGQSEALKNRRNRGLCNAELAAGRWASTALDSAVQKACEVCRAAGGQSGREYRSEEHVTI